MRPSWKKACRGLALLVAFAVMQVYVLATPTTPPTAKSNETASSTVLFGRLSTLGEGKVVVNGSPVLSGTTILSGAQLQTPATAGATVNLGAAGKLDIAPQSNLTLFFDQNSVTVNIMSGDALLMTGEGVKGSLTTPDGKTKLADGKSASSLGSAKFDADANPQNSDKCRIADMPCWLFWTLVGGGTATVIIIVAATRGENPSS